VPTNYFCGRLREVAQLNWLVALCLSCRIHVAHYALGAGEVAKEVKRIIYAPPPPPTPAWCKDLNKVS
jgi:hypothetical protein